MVVFDRLFFDLEVKKVVAVRIRQAVVFYSNDIRVFAWVDSAMVALHRRSFEQFDCNA